MSALSSSPSSSNKKARTANQDAANAEFETLRQHILACPHVSKDSAATKAAIAGIDRELKRIDRDSKLQQKFTQMQQQQQQEDEDTVTVELPIAKEGNNTHKKNKMLTGEEEGNAIMTDDWQDIEDDALQHSVTGADGRNDSGINSISGGNSCASSSVLGKHLSKKAVQAIGTNNVCVTSPAAAIALALHSAMRSDILKFACTGVPEDEASSGGFAPPIRELPQKQFLPKNWDKRPDEISLRYRKNGTGSVVLKVQQLQEHMLSSAESFVTSSTDGKVTIEITLAPSSSKEPPSQGSLVFLVEDHINLKSWDRARSTVHDERGPGNGSGVAPALHYKALPTLLTNFAKTFDLGSVHDESNDTNVTVSNEQQPLPYIDTSVLQTNAASTGQRQAPSEPVPISRPVDSGRFNPTAKKRWKNDNPREPTTIYEAFPGLHQNNYPGGDFADDLNPANGVAPHFGGRPDFGGNMMGPNHPIFHHPSGGGITGMGPNSGFGMRPRFDPVGPPGGPQDPKSNDHGIIPGRRPPPGGSGEPNPDHLVPPNNLRNNMFL